MNNAQRKSALRQAEARFADALDAVEALPDNATTAQVRRAGRDLDAAEADLIKARAAVESTRGVHFGDGPISVREGDENLTYSRRGRNSFFRDLVARREGDIDAGQRLAKHADESRNFPGAEARDVTSSGGGAGFIPPLWLASEWAGVPRAGRKFANEVPKIDLPESGETMTVPKLSTGVTVASQTPENSAVSETDVTSTTVTAPMVTIAGQNDLSRQSLERSFPGLDEVIFADLQNAYDEKLDSQLLNGVLASGEHQGIRNVSGAITVTYTSGTPDGGALLQKIYGAVSQLTTQRLQQPDLIVMHPRRAAWLASTLSSTFPLFQQGQLMQAAGEQDVAFVQSIAGLRVVVDPNVVTNLGAGTNQDQVYVIRSKDFILSEGPLQMKVFEEVLSGNLTVRLQAYAFGFFVPHRFPKSIAIIDGTGLAAPAGF